MGFLMGPEALGSYMAGVTVSGVIWAIFQNNAGGAWDNAKKSFEAGVEINGEMTYKGQTSQGRCNWRYCWGSIQRYFWTFDEYFN